MPSILFVCLGNICRSPIAEGLMRNRVRAAGRAADFRLDSAGLGPWHVGDPPDERAVAAAARHGVDISGLRGRRVGVADFSAFDLILGMDRQNVAALTALAPKGARARVGLYLQECLGRRADVPDPYYEDDAAFDRVFDLCDRASAALIGKYA